MLEKYEKAIPLLSINDAYELKKRVQQLEDNEAQKVELTKQIEAMVQEKVSEIFGRVDISKLTAKTP